VGRCQLGMASGLWPDPMAGELLSKRVISSLEDNFFTGNFVTGG
jgi:hypothetical protein